MARLWAFLKSIGEACFPMMNCRHCGIRTAKVDDGLCATCWWDYPDA